MVSSYKKLSPYKKILIIGIIFFAFTGMPFLAMNPAIDKIQTEIFPQYSLASIQTAITSVNIFSTLGAIICTILLQKRIITQKCGFVLGFLMLALSGVVSLFMHNAFWQLYVMAAFMGIGMGFNTITGVSIEMIEFDEGEEMSFVCSVQASFVNIGGIILSIVGGLLAKALWYSGYLIMIVTFIPMFYVYFAFKGPLLGIGATGGEKRKMTPLNPKLYYYGSILLIMMILYNVAGCNISTHIAQNELGGTSLSGIANSMCMVGGIIGALCYAPAAKKIGEYAIPMGAGIMGLGYIILRLFPNSVVMMIVGLILAGSALGFIPPQVIAGTSLIVDETNSSVATLIVNCCCSAIGCQVSPFIMTGITSAIAGENTAFRFLFTGIICFIVGVIWFFTTKAYSKKKA